MVYPFKCGSKVDTNFVPRYGTKQSTC